MKTPLGHLIPLEILAYLQLERIDIAVVLQGYPVHDRWPSVRFIVDGKVIYDGSVSDHLKLTHQSQAKPDQTHCEICIEYHGKSDADTEVSPQGDIVANQSVAIKELWINDVDIVKTGSIHQGIGAYTMRLPAHKQQYFAEHGISTEPTTHTHMFENGVWRIELPLPLLSTLTGLYNYVEPWERVDVAKEVNLLAQTLLRCQQLEKSNA